MTADYTLPPFPFIPTELNADRITYGGIKMWGHQCAEAARAPLIAANAALSEANASLLARIAELEADAKRSATLARAFRNRLVGAIADMCVGEYEVRIADAENRVNQFEAAFTEALEKQKVKESGDA